MREAGRQIRLGAFLTAAGQHVAAWRHPDVPADAGVNLKHYVNVVRLAERGKFDMMFLADNAGVWERDLASNGKSGTVAYFEPITLLSALAAVTDRIGLVATATTTYNEPFNIARKFASLDHISGGRAGWNVVTSANEAEALNFGFDHHMAHAKRYERAHVFVKVVSGLWNSWEDDSFPRDKKTGQYFKPDTVHRLNHKGERFNVMGPLNIPRTPQGSPVVVEAGSSEAGMRLAAATAEVVFTAQPELSKSQEFYAALKKLTAEAGRSPEHLKIMPGISPIVGSTEREAQEKYERLQELIEPEVGLGMLSSMLGGADLSGYDLDAPLPHLPLSDTGQSRQEVILKTAADEGLTLRQLYMRVAGARGHNIVIGTPDQIADRMAEWFQGGAADGFNIMPQTLPAGLEDFVEYVIPVLQDRGLFRRDYEGTTLREHLGLERPTHGC